MPQTNRSSFIGRLESMRGIAALCVAIFHSFCWLPIFGQLYSIMPIWQVTGLQARLAKLIISLTHGIAWVNFFFVLSGFVLARSLTKESFSLGNWAHFVIRRVVRIMPTYFVALLGITGLLGIRYAFHLFPDAYDGWFPSLHFARITSGDFLRNLTFQTNFMDPPSWSLSVEMIAAVSFPAVFAICRRIGAAANVSVWIALAIVTVTLEVADPAGASFLAVAYKGLLYIIGNYMFLIGITCALYAPKLVKRLSDGGLTWVAIGSIAAISLPALFCGQYNGYANLASGLGSLGLVAVLAGDRKILGFGWLDRGPARFMGRISFSFYVLHYLVMYVVVAAISDHKIMAIWDRYPLAYMAVSALLSVAICIPLAWVLFTYVERPSISLTKKLVARRAAKLLESSTPSLRRL